MTWTDKLGCAAFILAGMIGLVCCMIIAHGWYRQGEEMPAEMAAQLELMKLNEQR